MKVLIVSGFLGAGKTTFIREMSRKTSLDFVVMENEYGEVGIDADLLDNDRQMDIWELTEGCICCSMKSDFASSVLTIANTLDPEYLIVEPTGVGVLSNVIRNLQQIQYQRITLLSPVTILDARNFNDSLREYRELMEDQIRASGTIVVSKRDFGDSGASPEARLLETEIRRLNPGARIQIPHYSALPAEWWKDLLTTDLEGRKTVSSSLETPDLENLGLKNISLPSGNHLIAFLERLISGAYGNIWRAKGFVRTGDCWLRFDVVNGQYTIAGFQETEIPKSIFIGKNLQRGALRKALLLQEGAAGN